MSRINTAVRINPQTHEGAPAKHISAELELYRSVMACMLWEDQFYEDGASIADRICSLIPKVSPETVATIAVKARTDMKLRHVPLLLAREMARLQSHKHVVADTLERIIQRPDELAEFLALYWKDKRQPLSAQVKKGLARAFPKFNAYSLAKYNRDNAVKLRDVMFLAHPKPENELQGETWKLLVDGQLASPDTWEVNLSAGADKKETFTRLLLERKLGGLALLRNLRNMVEAGVSDEIIRHALNEMVADRILPFRFITAARYAPRFEAELEQAMFRCLDEQERLSGTTLLLVDVSGSMDNKVSTKSEITRLDAACGVAMLLREISTNVVVHTFSNVGCEVPPRRGFALAEAIRNSQPHRGTYLGAAVTNARSKVLNYDRMIVITDEQSADPVSAPRSVPAYMINVASNQNGVGYKSWIHIDGWSEAVVNYIQAYEKFGSR